MVSFNAEGAETRSRRGKQEDMNMDVQDGQDKKKALATDYTDVHR